jgi:hypothetical protein
LIVTIESLAMRILPLAIPALLLAQVLAIGSANACDYSEIPLTPQEQARVLKNDAEIRDRTSKLSMVFVYSPKAPACCRTALFDTGEWRAMPADRKARFLQNMNFEEEDFFAAHKNIRAETSAGRALYRQWERQRRPNWRPIGFGHRYYTDTDRGTCNGNSYWRQTEFNLPDIRTWPRQPDGTVLAEFYGYKHSDRSNDWRRDFVVLSYHFCRGPFDQRGHCPR